MSVLGARTTRGIVDIRVTSGGVGYTEPAVITINGAAAAPAAATALMAGTRLESIILTSQGAGYTQSPTVTVSPKSVGVTISSFAAGSNSGTITFSASAATTWSRIVAGSQTQTITSFVNNTEAIVATTSFPSSGAATLYSAGTGAAATAASAASALRPMSFFKGRFGTVYGVDGMGRGIRWDGGSSAYPIGLHKPAAPGVTVVASTAGSAKRVTAIQLVDGGRGYSKAPSVSFSGGGGTGAAAQAAVLNGAVVGVRVSTGGASYSSAPVITFSGGFGTSATFTVGVKGKVVGFDVTAKGSGYTSSGANRATIAVNATNGLANFQGIPLVNAAGEITGVQILAEGTGATTTPTFTVGGGIGSSATVTPRMEYAVDTITTGHTGDGGYLTAPFLTIRRAATDNSGGGAEAEVTVASGFISSVSVIAGGAYEQPPTALIVDTAARAQASVALPQRGKYLCGIRYIDDTSPSAGGPLASSISHLVEVEAGDGANNLTWAFSHAHVDDRVTAMELWRTTGDQSILLFRVATIKKTDANWGTTYADILTDPQLTDTKREGYGLMPITLPSGQINARRFEVPPGQFAVGVMFQDRAWYAVDITGQQPNSLYYSEIDEPESVPAANELVVQENTDLPDAVVALVPLGPSLLVVQSNHVYRLTYVAQPLLDASIMLAANRGVINNRCWAVMAGVAFLADSVGMYAFDGNQEQSISAAVDNYWRDGVIDFSKSDKFHMDADFLTRTVRFYYCTSSDSEPVRALCYCTATQAWWEESYPAAVTAVAGIAIGGQLRRAIGLSSGGWRKDSGNLDGDSGVAYSLRTGNMPLVDEPNRAIDILYKPTTNDSTLNVALHYNNSQTPRQNAIQSDRGTGFTVTAGGPAALNLKKTRSALGDATGSATAYFSGRKSDRSAGGDQHIAVAYSGTQASSAAGDAVVLYGTRIEGVK